MRKVAREVAFKLIYEFLFNNEKSDYLNSELVEVANLDQGDHVYLENVYHGVIDKLNTLKDEIDNSSEGYKIDRIYKIDLAILLLAIYEMRYVDDVPVAVAINEAVELAKLYSTENSGSFINGILSTVSKK